MKDTTTPTEISFDKLPQAIAKVYDEVFLIRNQLAELKQNFQPVIPPEWLTRQEVAALLKVDLSTLWNWHQKGKLIPFGIGNRVLYKRSDIEQALILLGTKKGLNDGK